MVAISATMVAWWDLGLPRLVSSPEAPVHARIEALERCNRDTRHPVPDQAWWRANPLGLLWPEMDAAFVTSGGGRPAAAAPVGVDSSDGESDAGVQGISSAVVEVTPGDSFELIARQTSGSTKNLAADEPTWSPSRWWSDLTPFLAPSGHGESDLGPMPNEQQSPL